MFPSGIWVMSVESGKQYLKSFLLRMDILLGVLPSLTGLQ